jgi:hypothetical protein
VPLALTAIEFAGIDTQAYLALDHDPSEEKGAFRQF